MDKQHVGVLAMAYGTPRTSEEIEPYYTHIRRGRPPEPHQLQELIDRYSAIGGLSPLNEITEKQVRGLEEALNRLDSERSYTVYTGMKHAHPFIAETVKQMTEVGVREAVGIVLAPHYSVMSVGDYIKYVKEAASDPVSPNFRFVESWHLEPKFIESTANRVQEALNRFPEEVRADVPILFTAHSLPERILQMGDPYPEQIRQTAEAVALAIDHQNWRCGWQSAGRTHEPWLGPDILQLLQEMNQNDVKQVIICPVGFVSDHLEVLYDIDIEAQALAKDLGIQLVRTSSPNAETLFLEAMASAILKRMAESA